MRRKILIPYSGDPCVFCVSVENIRYLKDLVDDVYVYLDERHLGSLAGVSEYLHEKCAGFQIVTDDGHSSFSLSGPEHRNQHGLFLRKLVSCCDPSDQVCLMEEDCFVFDKQVIRDGFSDLERFDMVGSYRGFLTSGIYQEFQRQYDHRPLKTINPALYPGFWPTLFFTNAKTLLETDGMFGAVNWDAGKPISYLNNYCPLEDSCGDTFVHTSMMLHSQGKRPNYIPAHLWFDVEPKNVLGETPYLHVNSLSNGIHRYLRSAKDRSYSIGGVWFMEPYLFSPEMVEDMNRTLSKNVLVWSVLSEFFERDPLAPKEYVECYREAISFLGSYIGYSEKPHLKETLRRRIQGFYSI